MMVNSADNFSNLSGVERLLMSQLDLESKLDEKPASDNGEDPRIWNYIDNLLKNPIIVNDDFKDLKWLNVSKPLSLEKDLKGLLIVCDFFTYCCINCLHVLPFLHGFKKKYSSRQVLLVGVHSPKFENEKSFQNVASAVIRHKIDHPVCNDPELKLWNQLSISCWPTVAIIGPNGELLFLLIGENALQNKLESYIDASLKYFSKHLHSKKHLSLPIDLLKNRLLKNILHYPTKISLNNDETRIVIANTLQHSIIISNIYGLVEFTIGGPEPGFQNGSFEKCLFNYPQGVTWYDQNIIYVCDTENQAIRKVDIRLRMVETVYCQKDLINQTPNSPWDLVYNPNDNRLYIAMAGTHQIWTLILSQEGDFVHESNQPYGSCLCFAGDGNEQKRNHRSLLKSSFAQPSGLSVNQNMIYVADSESSSIRIINLKNQSVSTLVGGSANPKDLFAFGDNDGIGLKCRLQHCMGICSIDGNIILIADTFNHKIKQIDITNKKCETLQVIWDNIEDERKYLNEPNGLCYVGNQHSILITDTNNHRIVSINLENGQASLLNLTNFGSTLNMCESPTSFNNNDRDVRTAKLLQLSIDQEAHLYINFKFNDDMKANSDAKQKIKCLFHDDLLIDVQPKFLITKEIDDVKFVVKSQKTTSNRAIETELSFECDLNLCHSKQNYCSFAKLLIKQPIKFNNYQSNNGRIIENFINIHL